MEEKGRLRERAGETERETESETEREGERESEGEDVCVSLLPLFDCNVCRHPWAPTLPLSFPSVSHTHTHTTIFPYRDMP